MSGAGLNADQDRIVSFMGFLECCCEFETMGWNHPIVMITGFQAVLNWSAFALSASAASKVKAA